MYAVFRISTIQEQMESIRATLPAEFCGFRSPEEFRANEVRRLESGTDPCEQARTLNSSKFGILNEELLAFAPPAPLNSYLPMSTSRRKRRDDIDECVRPLRRGRSSSKRSSRPRNGVD